MPIQAQRQRSENLVYWPVPQRKKQPVNMAKNHTNRSNSTVIDQEQASRWRQHMAAIAGQQDKQAFQAIYLHFAPKIKSFYLNQGMAHHAEELMHEAFIKIWQKAASYHPEKANVSTWIFTIVRNLRIDFLRRKRIAEVSDEDSPEVGDNGSLELDLDALRDNKQLASVFKLLNIEQRNVLQKVYFEDKSHQAAALELDMTPGVVKSRIRSALKVLRTHLGGE